MALDEQLLNRGANSSRSDSDSGESAEENDDGELSLREAKQLSKLGASGSTQADNLKTARQKSRASKMSDNAKIAAQLIAGNKAAAAKALLKKKMRKRMIMWTTGICAPCCLQIMFWVVIIALLLKVVDSIPFIAEIGWVWAKVKDAWGIIAG